MENYGKILDTLEHNVKTLEEEKNSMLRDRDKAVYEVKMIR